MTTTLNGRTVQAILKQNTGNTGVDGSELDISGYILTLGNLSWSVDENLTKLSLGNLSITTTDDDSSTVWSFLLASLTSGEGLLPPWLFLLIDGVQRFAGIIKEAPTRTQDSGNLEISINAVDWSSMLESKKILATDTSLSRLKDFRNGTGYAAGSSVVAKSVYNKELRRGHDRTTVCIPTSETNNFNAGDWVYFANYSSFTQYNQKYPVLATTTANIGGLGTMYVLYLGGSFWWSENPGDTQNFGQTSSLYRLYSSTGPNLDTTTNLPKFVAAESFTVSTAGTTAKTSIVMTYVDGLQPGDKLDKITNFLSTGDATFSITVVDVDTTTNTVYLDAPLNNDLVSGVTSFQLSTDSLSQSVLVSMRDLIEKAVKGFAQIDYSSYSQSTLPSPCFSFIGPKSPSSQNTHTETLVAVQDLQPSLTGFEVKGSGALAWTGLPAAGWDTTTWTKKVNWTSQQTTAPSYLIPYLATPSDAGAGTEEVRGHTTYPGLRGWKDDKRGDPDKTGNTVMYKDIYDYSSKRCYRFRWGPGLSLLVQFYNGSAWSTVSGFSVTGIGAAHDIAVFPDAAISIGSGSGLIALYGNGTVKTILSTVSLTATLQGDDVVNKQTGVLQTHLKTTSNGVYYVTPTGYGQIYISGGVLKSKWVKILDDSNGLQLMQTITPITNTFTYANGRIITLAKVSYKNSITDARFVDDTYLLQLNKDVQGNAADSVISSDFIVKNIPRTTVAVKSPVSEDIFGFMGGRLFQINKSLPETVERFTSTNQTAQGIIEFVSAMTNTVACPVVSGSLKLISRGFNSTPTNVTVDNVSIRETRWNKHMSSCVVIKGLENAKGKAVSTTQLSGLTISYQNDVYIRNSSQATAIAQSYLAFFEKPRKEVEQVWFSYTTPAPWEALQPMQIITINGAAQQYYLTGLSHDLANQTATAQLLEVV